MKNINFYSNNIQMTNGLLKKSVTYNYNNETNLMGKCKK